MNDSTKKIVIGKEEEIKKEKKRLRRIFKEIDANKLAFVMHQIDNLAWLNVST